MERSPGNLCPTHRNGAGVKRSFRDTFDASEREIFGMKTLGWEGVDLRKARKFGSNRRSGAGAASQLCFCGLAGGFHGIGIAPELLGFSSPLKIPIRLEGFWDKSLRDPLGVCLFRSPPGRGPARGGCSGARFVTLCVFSPLSPLLSAPLQVPSSPRYLRIRQPNLEIINLEWDHPEHPNGVITGYTLRYQPCTSHVLLSVINQGILPFLLFPRAGDFHGGTNWCWEGSWTSAAGVVGTRQLPRIKF